MFVNYSKSLFIVAYLWKNFNFRACLFNMILASKRSSNFVVDASLLILRLRNSFGVA